jgi:hypothetical protein
MSKILTRKEIETRFDAEWILIADPELDRHMNVLRGEVVSHSRERDEVYQKAIDLRLKHSAFLYIGEVPGDAVFVL